MLPRRVCRLRVFLNDRSKRVSLGLQAKQVQSDLRRDSSMPEVGEMAPDFELKSHLEKDKKVKLSDFRGQKNVVIAFYPLAWTPV
jgi:peroxiredoxin